MGPVCQPQNNIMHKSVFIVIVIISSIIKVVAVVMVLVVMVVVAMAVHMWTLSIIYKIFI